MPYLPYCLFVAKNPLKVRIFHAFVVSLSVFFDMQASLLFAVHSIGATQVFKLQPLKTQIHSVIPGPLFLM